MPGVVGLLYDVHGNLPALEAVLADCPAESFLLGGDYATFGAWPVQTVERLRELDAEWIRGNVDRWLVDAPDAPGGVGEAVGERPLDIGVAHVDDGVVVPLVPGREARVEQGQVLLRHLSVKYLAACRLVWAR